MSSETLSGEGQEAVAAVDDIGQHHQTTEGNPGIQLVRGDPVLLTPVGTDEQLHAAPDEVGIPGISKVLHPLVDAIEIHIMALGDGF